MPIKNVANRNQLKLINLDELIDEDNRVRKIDKFVQLINPAQLQFKIKGQYRAGKPAFSEKVLIAIYLYGYSNRIRSSRKLEQACNRSINYHKRSEEEYVKELDENDSLETSIEKGSNDKLELIRKRRKRYEALKNDKSKRERKGKLRVCRE